MLLYKQILTIAFVSISSFVFAQNNSIYSATGSKANGKLSGEFLANFPISKGNNIFLVINMKDSQNNVIKSDTANYTGGVFQMKDGGWSALYPKENGIVKIIFERKFSEAVLSSSIKVELSIKVDAINSNTLAVNLSGN